MSDEILTKGSLCTGVGGLDAFLPGELTWVAETDESASAVLKREHPDAPNLGDILTAEWNYEKHHVDLLTSGDPCQSMSIAGAKRASEDDRFLWPHVMDVIRTVRPKQVFLENVQNVTSVALVKGAEDWRGQKGSVLVLRLADLREAGYACRWTVLGACAVGAPHHRHRWFLHGRYVGVGAPEAERVTVKCGAPRSGGRPLLPTPKVADSRGPGTARMARGEDPWHDLPTYVQLLPTPTARDSEGGGEGSSEFWAQRSEYRGNGVPLGAAVTLLPTPRATDGTSGGPNQYGSRGDLTMGSAVQAEHWGKFAPAVALWTDVLGTLPPEPTEPASRGGGRRLNARLSEWMMGHRAGFLTDGFSRNDALRLAGNGAMPLQSLAAWRLLTGDQRA